jgi:curved DNA-binding protein CbpA
MMKKIEDLNYYELLEISPTASAQEIHKAYERIRRVYEPNSIALYSLLTADESAAIHQRIEEAYRTLVYEDNRKIYDALLRGNAEFPEPRPASICQPRPVPLMPAPVRPAASLPAENRYLSGAEPPPPAAPPKPAQEEAAALSQLIGEFTGPAIRALREQRCLSLTDVANMTKVSARYLEHIEEEAFKKLPVRPYLRGFLMLYAKALGCDPDRMAGDYLKRFEAAMNPPAKK